MGERVVVAPDAFKGTFSAASVAAAIAAGVREGGARADECPVADGGEGTMDVLLGALGGERRTVRSSDALGREIRADWALLADGSTAVVEAAQASGQALIADEERDAERASTAGTGELILAARRGGAQRAIVCVGGTATSDGGMGALEVIEAGGGLQGMALVLVCDVLTPFELAVETFSPQKGASVAALARLAARMEAIAAQLPKDPRGVGMTGAGGGLAGGLWARYGAELRSGADFVLEAVGFERRLASAAAVVIGEGRLDRQTLEGKIGGVILGRARERRTPVHAIVANAAIDPGEPAWQGLASIAIADSLETLRARGRAVADGIEDRRGRRGS